MFILSELVVFLPNCNKVDLRHPSWFKPRKCKDECQAVHACARLLLPPRWNKGRENRIEIACAFSSTHVRDCFSVLSSTVSSYIFLMGLWDVSRAMVAMQASDRLCLVSLKHNRIPRCFLICNPVQICICPIRGIWHTCFLLLSTIRALGGNERLKSNLAEASGFH